MRRRVTLNGVWRNIASDTLTLGAHFVRPGHVPRQLTARDLNNDFAARISTAPTAIGCSAINSLQPMVLRVLITPATRWAARISAAS